MSEANTKTSIAICDQIKGKDDDRLVRKAAPVFEGEISDKGRSVVEVLHSQGNPADAFIQAFGAAIEENLLPYHQHMKNVKASASTASFPSLEMVPYRTLGSIFGGNIFGFVNLGGVAVRFLKEDDKITVDISQTYDVAVEGEYEARVMTDAEIDSLEPVIDSILSGSADHLGSEQEVRMVKAFLKVLLEP